MIYIVFGVCGSGKTVIGKLLAETLEVPFYDADDFHAPEMVEKMRKGLPLNDQDRDPWLKNLARGILAWEKEGGAVLACSALREKYRSILKSIPENKISWVFLSGTKQLIADRMKRRKGHYMNPTLLESQFAALEVPSYGLHIDVAAPPEEIVRNIRALLPAGT